MAEREPAWCSMPDDKDIRIQELEQKLENLEVNLFPAEWSKKQWDEVRQLEAELLHVHSHFHKPVEKKAKKSKYLYE